MSVVLLGTLKKLSIQPIAAVSSQLQLSTTLLDEAFFHYYYGKTSHLPTKALMATHLAANKHRIEHVVIHMKGRIMDSGILQIRRSGLQFLIDDFAAELGSLTQFEPLRELDEDIQRTLKENGSDGVFNMSRIPPSHHAWIILKKDEKPEVPNDPAHL